MATMNPPKRLVKKLTIPKFEDYFPSDHIAAHIKGAGHRNLFEEAVDEFFTKMKRHVYVAGQPGVGKTWTVEQFAQRHPNIYCLTIKGNISPWAFFKLMAVTLYRLPAKMKLAVFIDDMNHIFKSNSEYIDIFKIAMDKKSGDRLEYNVSLGAQYANAEPIEQEAIDFFKAQNPERTGFIIPFNDRVKFIFCMNTTLPSQIDLDQVKNGSDVWNKLNNRMAIRSRTRYEDLVMKKEEHWGWMADVVWNNPNEMCVGATYDQRYAILTWYWDNWTTVSEHSLRFIEESLWDIMQDYPREIDYKRRWEKLKG